jgi:hypothetical protein
MERSIDPPSCLGPSAVCAVRGARLVLPPDRFLVAFLDPYLAAAPASTRGFPGRAR